MRVINAVVSKGVEYESVWGPLSLIDKSHANTSAMALAVRSASGEIETIIHRNAKLADVQSSLRHLRSLGIDEKNLSELFNHKGKFSGLAQHVKALVANLR
jgi:dihydrodipicolinate synthase/N-acetylneuraminate lyase